MKIENKIMLVEVICASFIALLVCLCFVMLGCKEDPLKTSYGEWNTSVAKVLDIADGYYTIGFDAEPLLDIKIGNIPQIDVYTKKVRMKSDNVYKVGDKLAIKYRSVFKTLCENNRCELLSTSYEIKIQ